MDAFAVYCINNYIDIRHTMRGKETLNMTQLFGFYSSVKNVSPYPFWGKGLCLMGKSVMRGRQGIR